MHPRFLVLAEGQLNQEEGKTATSAVRYLGDRVAAVIDSANAGRTCQDALGFGGPIPIVSDLQAGLRYSPEALLIGAAPAGGRLPPRWGTLCVRAARAGLDIWSGLHILLAEEPEIAEAAVSSGARIRDLRRPPDDLTVASGAARDVDATVILTVGSDCAVGKLTTALEVVRALAAAGEEAAIVPTGQTGILIEGWGIAVDAVKSDFVAGAAEALVLEAARRGHEFLIVEGQGALTHPAYSGVTLGLMHGSVPRGMILCHAVGRHHHSGGAWAWTALPDLSTFVETYEQAAAWLRPAPVVGLALNTSSLSERDAREAVDRARSETGLPACDPVRDGAAALARAILDLTVTS